METPRVIKIGFSVDSYGFSKKTDIFSYLSQLDNLHGRILLTLIDYLRCQSKKFDDIKLTLTDTSADMHPNGNALTGLFALVNRSEVDIGVQPYVMRENDTEKLDFAYPYEISYLTFMTQKPDYEPQIFGIFQTFSLSIWITIISVFIVMSLVYYVALKTKYPLDSIFLHVLAVFVRQSAIIMPSSWAENLLVYSWVLGAMVICLAYDSVFLSFLAFPPVIQIKDLSDLATAVKNGEYHCLFPSADLLDSKQKNLRIIATDVMNNNIPFDETFHEFVLDRQKLKIAALMNVDGTEVMKSGNKFVSEDRFHGHLSAMIIGKDFCCKKMINTFVHRLMASGLYFKFHNDRIFLFRKGFYTYLPKEEEESSSRKLTLTDVAPAFIILLVGYFVSFLVFTGEIMYDRKRKRKCFKKTMKRQILDTEV